MIDSCRIISLLGSGKSGDSYLINCNGNYYVYKKMHNKPFINGHVFTIEDELRSYHLLKAFNINVPSLVYYDVSASYLIKTYIEGETLAHYIIEHAYPISLYLETYKAFIDIEKLGFTLDYFPTNFILKDNKLWYIDYEVNPFNEKWSFLSWGIHFWFNKEGFIHYFNHNNNHDLLLLNPEDGTPFNKQDHQDYQYLISLIKNT